MSPVVLQTDSEQSESVVGRCARLDAGKRGMTGSVNCDDSQSRQSTHSSHFPSGGQQGCYTDAERLHTDSQNIAPPEIFNIWLSKVVHLCVFEDRRPCGRMVARFFVFALSVQALPWTESHSDDAGGPSCSLTWIPLHLEECCR